MSLGGLGRACTVQKGAEGLLGTTCRHQGGQRQEGPPQILYPVLEAVGSWGTPVLGMNKANLCVVSSSVFWQDREGAVILQVLLGLGYGGSGWVTAAGLAAGQLA